MEFSEPEGAILGKAQFCEDCLVADAVLRNRLPPWNWRLSQNLTEKTSIFDLGARNSTKKQIIFQLVTRQFSEKANR